MIAGKLVTALLDDEPPMTDIVGDFTKYRIEKTGWNDQFWAIYRHLEDGWRKLGHISRLPTTSLYVAWSINVPGQRTSVRVDSRSFPTKLEAARRLWTIYQRVVYGFGRVAENEDVNPEDVVKQALQPPKFHLQRAGFTSGHFAVVTSTGQTVGTIMRTDRGWTPYSIVVNGLLRGLDWAETFRTEDEAARALWKRLLRHNP